MRHAPAVVVLLSSLAIPGCGSSPAGPSSADLSGRWSGTSTYPNSPFTLQLTQTATTLRGNYADTLDRSIAVTGTYQNSTMQVVIDFGDAKLNLEGSVVDARTVQGNMYTSALGNRRYPFTMTR